jgi:hypothetical protein
MNEQCMKYLIIFFITGLNLITGPVASAAETHRFGLGAHLQLSNWKGDNNGTSPDFEANANQLALSLRYQYGRFYSGLSLQDGSFDFTNGAPERNNKTISVATPNVTIDRGEVDLLAGYYFWPQVSLFVDIKNVTNTWRDLGYSEKVTGLGLGISGFALLPNNWIFYASFGIVPLTIETGSDTIGDGNGASLELGTSYTINNHHHVSVGVKSQSQTYNFDNGHKQKHQLGGLVLGYNYTF